MFIVIYALYTMNSSIQWKQMVFSNLTVTSTFLLITVFLPRIKKDLNEFKRAWNMHLVQMAKIMINSMIREAKMQESLNVPVE